MARLEFFFDCSSPWTYLALHRVESVAAEAGAVLVWKPILVGGVFNAVNPGLYEARANPVPARAAYQAKDLQDWARRFGLEIGRPPVFPVNSVKAMRACFVADASGRLPQWARAVCEAYWGALEDISQDDVLRRIAVRVGLDPDAVLAGIAAPEIRQRLRETTDELIARGGFGSPTFFVDGTDMYFGNDRLELIGDALRAARARTVAAAPAPELVRQTIERHFQYWNERRREDWLALCSDDVTFDDPVGVPTKYGRAAAARQWDASYVNGQVWTLRALSLQICGDEAAAVVHQRGVIGANTYEFESIEVWRVDGEGRICAVKAYYRPPDDIDGWFKPPPRPDSG
jgi:2-hydroxychromene-2-carboxylate isomerase